MRQDFFPRRIARQTPSRESDRGGGSTEWQCRPHPSRGCSFAGHQPQPSANVNHEYTRMNTNCFDAVKSLNLSDTDHGQHVSHGLERTRAAAGGTRCSQRVGKQMWLSPLDACAYRELLAIVFGEKPIHGGDQYECCFNWI